jgi:hypothetical protein
VKFGFRALAGAVVQVVGTLAKTIVSAVISEVIACACWGRSRRVARSEEAACTGFGVGVLSARGGVLLEDINGVRVNSSDDGDVTISAGSTDPQISRLRIRGVRDARRIATAHHVGIVMPDRSDTMLLMHISLSEFNALICATCGDRTTTATSSALILSITLGSNTIVTSHGSTT